jgi:hypothetical protein
MRAIVLMCALTSGCAALPDDGALACNPNPTHACPDGFQCASDGRCYRVGHGPGMDDLSVPGDNDMGTGDMVVVASCSTSSTCPAGAPVCNATQMCSSCGAEGSSNECATYHAPTPLCGPNGGCVQCFNKDQCEASQQTCNLMTYSCGPCAAHADCSSGFCNVSTGVCAAKSALYYVNNAPAAGCSDGGPGSFTMPFCSIQKGLNTSAVNASKPVIVYSGTYAEAVSVSPSLVGNANYITTAIGIGGPVIKPAGAGSALAMGGAPSYQMTLTLDGFVLDGSGITDGSNVIECTGGSAVPYGNVLLTLLHTTIKNGPAFGLNLTQKSKVVIDSVQIYGNVGGGISSAASDFAITNAVIRNNGSASATSGGLYLVSAGETGKMTMANVTVVANTTQSGSSLSPGTGCVVPMSSIINTVVTGNVGGPGQYDTTSCGGTSSNNAYTGAGAGNENLPSSCTLSDLFVDPPNADYHPKKGGAVPCTLVDQGLSNGAPDHDLDGVRRPQPAGGAFDIGAFEAK